MNYFKNILIPFLWKIKKVVKKSVIFFFPHKNFAKNGPLTNSVRAIVNKILIKKKK